MIFTDQQYKRELARTSTLSVEEVGQIIGVSATAVKQFIVKENDKFTFKSLDLENFDIEKLMSGEYLKQKVGVILEPRGSKSISYRLLFSAVKELTEKVFSRYSKSDATKYIDFELEKLTLRKKLLLDLMQKEYSP